MDLRVQGIIESTDLVSLLYVSHSRTKGAGDVRRIVEVSRRRNQTLDVTGALISLGGYFAQILEGPGAAVDELMRSIGGDARHENVAVTHRRPVPHRSFHHWALAYWGSDDGTVPTQGRGREIYDAIRFAQQGYGETLYLLVGRISF